MAELRIENLTKIYGDTAVVDRVSFTVAEGEFCILLGPSGCGKSTILRLIAGLEHQEGGTIHIGGVEVSDRNPKDRDVAMVFQSYALYPHLSVYDNIAFPLRIRKLPRRDADRKVREAARMLDITDLLERRPREISGGQRQRVAIGRAIVRNPQLFLFDEPLSNLDAKLRATMRVELAGLHRRLQATTLYVTHDQVEAMTLGQMIVLLDRGVIQQVGSPRDLYERPVNVFTASFIGIPPINLFEGIVSREGDGQFIRCAGFRMDVGERRELEGYEGRAVTVGVRPEAVRVGPGQIRALLEHAEHMGSETILYLRTEELKVVARAAADFQLVVGEPVGLDFDPKSLHFFFDGRRI
ncbi:MAG: ABC transporter ATP-binding protein [Syntrophales bacterium]